MTWQVPFAGLAVASWPSHRNWFRPYAGWGLASAASAYTDYQKSGLDTTCSLFNSKSRVHPTRVRNNWQLSPLKRGRPRQHQSCCCRHLCSFVISGPVYLSVVAGGLPLLSSSPESRRMESGRCDGNNWSLSSSCSMFTFCALVCHEPCWAQVLLFARPRLSVGFFFLPHFLAHFACPWSSTRLVRLLFVTCIQLIKQFSRHSQGPFFVERSLPQLPKGACNSIRNYSARNTVKKTHYDNLYFYFS